MKSSIYHAPVCRMKALNNLFIELTEKNCNQRCKHCYIDFPISKKVKDFITVDTIKKALNDTMKEPVECIYLTGAEPMTHPDFNSILRLCLKRCPVCIFTNGSFINEKKARFLKKVEDESEYEIIFKLSIDHYNEVKSDDIRGRGTYRQVLHALKSLIKYDFNPVLCVTNYYREDENILREELKKVCRKIGFDAQDYNIEINKCYTKGVDTEIVNTEWKTIDCEYGRILTAKGVYTCPFLSNDHRGRCGSDFSDYSQKTTLETPFCTTCIKNDGLMFGIDFQRFK